MHVSKHQNHSSRTPNHYLLLQLFLTKPFTESFSIGYRIITFIFSLQCLTSPFTALFLYTNTIFTYSKNKCNACTNNFLFPVFGKKYLFITFIIIFSYNLYEILFTISIISLKLPIGLITIDV